MPLPLGAGLLIGGAALKIGSALFGKSTSEKIRDAVRKSRERLFQRQQQEIGEAYSRPAQLTNRRISSVRQRAGEQASALGRPQDVGAMTIPLESNLATIGSDMTQNILGNVQQRYGQMYNRLDEAEINAEAGDETVLDKLGEIGGAVAQYGASDLMLDKMYPQETTGGMAPSEFPEISPEPDYPETSDPFMLGGKEYSRIKPEYMPDYGSQFAPPTESFLSPRKRRRSPQRFLRG